MDLFRLKRALCCRIWSSPLPLLPSSSQFSSLATPPPFGCPYIGLHKQNVCCCLEGWGVIGLFLFDHTLEILWSLSLSLSLQSQTHTHTLSLSLSLSPSLSLSLSLSLSIPLSSISLSLPRCSVSLSLFLSFSPLSLSPSLFIVHCPPL